MEIYVEESYNIYVPIRHHPETVHYTMAMKVETESYQLGMNKGDSVPADHNNSDCDMMQSEIFPVAL